MSKIRSYMFNIIMIFVIMIAICVFMLSILIQRNREHITVQQEDIESNRQAIQEIIEAQKELNVIAERWRIERSAFSDKERRR